MNKSMSTSQMIRRFSAYYGKYWRILAFDLVCASLTTICELVLPMIVRFITQAGISDMASLTVQRIASVGLLYLVLRVIDAAAMFYMNSYGHIMGARMETDMRRDLFASLQNQSFAFYSETKIGQVMARITSDLFDVTEFAHHCPEEFFISAIKIVAAFAILCSMNVWLTLIIFSVLPLMLVTTRIFNRRMREAFMDGRHQLGEINARVEDSLLGIRVVKSFANEDLEQEKFGEGNATFLKIKRRQYMYMAGFHSSTRLFDGLMYILVVVAGALFMIRGSISPADMVAYLLYVTTLLNSIRRIVEFTEQFQRGVTGVERFFQLIDAPVQIEDRPDAKELTDVRGDITFEHVGFCYQGETKEVLHDVTMHVKAGESVALVGPSGGGKTTLCSLIPRFYDVTRGKILVDGQDVRDLTLQSLRKQIGVVQQDVYLFSGTVYENIAYGKPGATREEIVEAAKQADAHSFIEQLPDGYETYIGERGVKLSGGQKQRVSIARVFLKNPPILILDEATSALDNESERIVQRSLERLAKGRTTFTIAHRLTTIRNASVIWVLTDEGIVERGTHQALMQSQGVYYGLYHQYMEAV